MFIFYFHISLPWSSVWFIGVWSGQLNNLFTGSWSCTPCGWLVLAIFWPSELFFLSCRLYFLPFSILALAFFTLAGFMSSTSPCSIFPIGIMNLNWLICKTRWSLLKLKIWLFKTYYNNIFFLFWSKCIMVV